MPVTGREADRIARLVGMPEFETDDTGTNILVVAPDLGGRTAEQAMTIHRRVGDLASLAETDSAHGARRRWTSTSDGTATR